ncbi:MAG: hypothetical protein HY827_00345 [Actinobacteria bacterium]|nr:hypothetical protein [Actinomycetota bacterium]
MDRPQTLFQQPGLAGAVATEAIEAGEIKNERPIMVVIGNPPYRGESSNKTEFAQALVAGYKVEPGGQEKLKERNPKWINDDYVKFIAFAQSLVARNGSGIVAMITNNGYLDNPTFRGMRWRLTQVFSEIFVLDLHGNSKKREVAPDGAKDQNVFDIQQGVAIFVGVLKQNKRALAMVKHAELWGTRSEKFEALAAEISWSDVKFGSRFNFVPLADAERAERYETGVSINELFPVSSVGVVTAADGVLVAFDKRSLEDQLRAAREGGDGSRINKRLSLHPIDMDSAGPFAYRPFDTRVVYYEPAVLERAREDVMRHFLAGPNVGLVAPRSIKEEPGVFITSSIIGHKLFGAYDINTVFPAYTYSQDGIRTPNLRHDSLKKLAANLSELPGVEIVFDYVYGVLHSPAYRKKYKELLKTGFPRVPVPADDAEFNRFVKNGNRLRELHLMTSPESHELITKFQIIGDNIVEKPRFDGNKVCINDKQFFEGVPEIAWDFYIGGYQPAQKWLKDRKGRRLSNGDIEHYQRIIAVLAKTELIMRAIDDERPSGATLDG